ncbi:metallophosphoesterase family protein [Thauera aromatica]|uniref:DNA double-strand break repair protein Mre11 n=1 Tax=Thauera aromatica K172 TaxID=44139 RepID=A0A2R4BIH4_THAAR|nr:DNA repair exonuclease [Thauera aromatica]AVR87033.1 DNA double-strand break repair protein Mre11 [Thauera aromatica K172]
MPRFLHTADWQIGKLFGQFEPDEAALLAEARFVAVERLARLAQEHAVDAVLVAGDVFDAQTVADRTIHRLFNALAGFAGPWLLLPGNHDAALAESVWTRAARLRAIPPNVRVCREARPVLLEAAGIAVLPAPLTQRNTFNDLTEWFAGADTPPALVRVGLAHGSVQGILAEDIDAANPIAADRAASARLDYLALGDWHGTRRIDARCWYAGTPETDRFRANDSGQALLVELAAPGALPAVSVLATGRYRWQALSAELQVASDVDRLLAELAGFGADDVVQLEVGGRSDLAGHRRLTDAIGQARGRARSLVAELGALQLEPTVADLEGLAADGYLGEVIARLQAAQHGAEPAAAQTARDALVLLAGLLECRSPAAAGAAVASAAAPGGDR